MLAAVGCKNKVVEEAQPLNELQQKVDEYAEFTLTTDLSVLSENEQKNNSSPSSSRLAKSWTNSIGSRPSVSKPAIGCWIQ